MTLAERPPISTGEALSLILHPKSIAILGASDDPIKIGGRPLRFLRESGFEGDIYPINPHRESVQGLPAFPSLRDVPGDVELALVAVPRDGVLAAIDDCVAKGVRCATIFSSGFAEADEEGERLQNEIAERAARGGVRLLGPNCIGSRSIEGGATATFAAVEGVPRPALKGRRVAFVSQSGAIAAHCVLEAFDRGMGFDPWISTGNEADIQFADALAALAADESVDAIAAYMEGCRDGDRLREALATAYRNRKPVFLLKVGRSAVGAVAAASHTASLVGSEEVFEALFRRYNVCRVDSMGELLDVAYFFARGIVPDAERIAMVTGSGGVGILMADAGEMLGLDVAPLALDHQGALKAIAPSAGVVNPFDTTAQVMNDPQLLVRFLTTVAESGQYDGIAAFLTYMGKLAPWAESTVQTLRAVRAAYPDLPIAVAMTSDAAVRAEVEDLSIPVFDDVVVLLQTMSRVIAVERGFDATDDYEEPCALLAPPASPPRTELAALDALGAGGVPVVAHAIATSAAEAARLAADAGFPVAMKIVSEDILHKTEAGGVRLGVADAHAASQAFEDILRAVSAHDPRARLDGVLIAPMISGGVEMIVGVQNDPVLGPAVMVGLGGIFVEVLRDVTYRLAPFGPSVARQMIEDLRGAAILAGVRGGPASDIAALADVVSAVSRFASANRGWVASIDVNPILVREDGRGAVALDALITTTPEDVDGP